MLRHFALVAALACAGCGIKGPLYLPTPAQPSPAAAPPAAMPPVAPGPSNPPPPGSPVEPKKN
jgi:predicted small lipoprotein YifL